MRPLSCAEAKQEAARRLFEPLEAHLEVTLSSHLAVCDECRVAAEDMAAAAGFLETSVLRHELPLDLETRLLASLRQEPAAPKQSRRRLLASIAAAVLMLCGVGLIVISPSEPVGQAVALAPADRYTGVRGTVALEGPAGALRLRLTVTGLPPVGAVAAYTAWAGADGRWARLGEFRAASGELLYPVSARPDLVRVTIESVGANADTPGTEVLTGKL
jgi:hypothetical protein